MRLILDRLKIISKMHNANLTQNIMLQDFIDTISAQTFKDYSSHVAVLSLDYRFILTYLNQKNILLHQEQEENEIKQNIILGILWLNAYLIHIYRHSGDFRCKTNALLRQRQNLMQALHQDYIPCDGERLSASCATRIHSLYLWINKPRNIIIRTVRALQASESVFQSSRNFTRSLQSFNRIADPILAFAAWIFFIPRFLVNCATVCRHFLFTTLMDDKERVLSRRTHIFLIRKNAITLMNDFIAIASSLVNCFIFIGKLSPIATYITAATFTFDIIVAIVLCIHACNRLKTLKSDYHTHQEDAALNAAIDKTIAYKKRKCIIQIMTTVSIALFFVLTLPLLGLVPVIPFIAQCMLLMIVISNLIATKLNAKTNPKTHNPIYSPHRFFNQNTTQTQKKHDILLFNDNQSPQYN